MRWRDWLRSTDGRRWTVREIAAHFRVAASTVARWDPVRPNHERMVEIARLTGGQVRPDDWFPELAGIDRLAPPRPRTPRRRALRAAVNAGAGRVA